MTTTATIAFLRRNSLRTVSTHRATTLAKAFGRTLSNLDPEFGRPDGVSVPVLACAIARIEIEILAHLMDPTSQYNTERAADHLAWAGTPHERDAHAARGGRGDGRTSPREVPAEA
jgi:hypothetical protein